MVFYATFNNISVISWPSVLLLEETGEYHRLVFHIMLYRGSNSQWKYGEIILNQIQSFVFWCFCFNNITSFKQIWIIFFLLYRKYLRSFIATLSNIFVISLKVTFIYWGNRKYPVKTAHVSLYIKNRMIISSDLTIKTAGTCTS